MKYKFGYVSIIGKPNAGKSTLINSLIGEKVAIVSNKPQTTRNNILGIYNGKKDNLQYQIVFIDTPGIHQSKNNLDKYMMKNVRSAIGGCDLLVYLIDGTKKVDEEELNYIKNLTDKGLNVIVCVTKIDVLKYESTLPFLMKIAENKKIKEIVPISSFQHKNVNLLIDEVLKQFPETTEKHFEFEEDDYTDKSLRFLCAEIIREKALLNLNQEIPHGIGIEIVSFKEENNLTTIEADIVCERDSHKGIILGSRGSMIKKIGAQARQDIENLCGTKVMLKLFVKTKKDWRNNTNVINNLGYNEQ